MRSIWKGTLSFGLVSIPVAVYPAEALENQVHFKLLDGKTMDPVRNLRINERTGAEVAYDDIVKGFEWAPDQYVVISQDEIRSALPTSSGTVDIVGFVPEGEIDPTYFSKPYYLEPSGSGRKPYVLLREIMARDGLAAVGRFVMRTKRYSVAIAPRGDVLVMSTLRYASEMRDAGELAIPSSDIDEAGVTDKELAMAEQLVTAMRDDWDPSALTDDYADKIRDIARTKAETGQIEQIEHAEAPEAGPDNVVDIMALLKKSLEQERGGGSGGAAAGGAATG
jgi:DNA end-binding protein Ku